MNYDRRRVAGSGISRGAFGIRAGLTGAMNAITQLDGLFHYRLHGEGHRDTFSGEPVLSPEDRKKADAGYAYLKRIKKGVEALADDVHNFEKVCKDLDEPMRYMAAGTDYAKGDAHMEEVADTIEDAMSSVWGMRIKFVQYLNHYSAEGSLNLPVTPVREGKITIGIDQHRDRGIKIEVTGLLHGDRPHHESPLTFKPMTSAKDIVGKVLETVEARVHELSIRAEKLPPNRV